MANDIPIEKLTKVYIKIRDKRAELSAAFKAEDTVLVAQQDKIKTALLDYCKVENANSINTPAGTVIRSITTKYWTSDWESMYRFVIDNEVPEFFTKSLNQTNVKAYLEENPEELPPGLNVDSEYVVSIRKPTKKR